MQLVNIQFYSLLRLMLDREKLRLAFTEGDSVRAVLDKVQQAINTDILHKLLDGEGVLQTGTIILLNRRNILDLDGLDTRVCDEDTLALFPPGAGG